MRSTARLNEIDTYLAEHYTKDGGRACADALGEKITYISSRVQMLRGLQPNNAPTGKAKKTRTVVLLAKLDASRKEVKELRDAYGKLKEEFLELRKENIIMIDEKVKAKARSKSE